MFTMAKAMMIATRIYFKIEPEFDYFTHLIYSKK